MQQIEQEGQLIYIQLGRYKAGYELLWPGVRCADDTGFTRGLGVSP